MDLSDSAALVTGGSGAVGRAVVEELAAAGADVTVGYHEEAEAAAAATESAREHGVDAAAVRADVTDPDAVEELVSQADAEGDLEVVVAAAGVTQPTPIEEVTPDVLDRILAVNVTGTATVARAVVERYRAGDGGAIVAISSVAAEIGTVDAAYATAKGGLHGLVRALARECGADGIRANAVAPGPVDSPMNDRVVEYLEDRRFRGHRTVDTLLDRYEATPTEVAEAVRFLAEQDFVTGEVLHVDGGMTL